MLHIGPVAANYEGGASLFGQFSERAKRVIFLARELASTKGAAAVLEPSHLLDALVREDQGEIAARPDVVRIGKSELRPAHPFFSAETASAVLVGVERILPPKAEPIPRSTDMPASPTLVRIFAAAMELAKELHHDQVEPLHLLAAVSSDESEPSSEILKQVAISREVVIAAIRK
jgi:ATP-dependent Clp protease ATP-binding subunit ClpA